MWRFIAGWLLVHWRWGHLKTTPALVDVWQDSETSHSKSSSGNFQHWYLADTLASVYSYRVMVKSVSSCCVRGRWVLSNPVTNMYLCRNINTDCQWSPQWKCTVRLSYQICPSLTTKMGLRITCDQPLLWTLNIKYVINLSYIYYNCLLFTDLIQQWPGNYTSTLRSLYFIK